MDKDSKIYSDLVSESQVLAALHMLSLLYMEVNNDSEDMTVLDILTMMKELGFTHLAMDVNGSLKGFFDKPKKENGRWHEVSGYELFIIVENFTEVNEYDKIEDSISFDIDDLIIDHGLVENSEKFQNTEIWKDEYEALQVLIDYWLNMENHEYRLHTKELTMGEIERGIPLGNFREIEEIGDEYDPLLQIVLESLEVAGIPIAEIIYHDEYDSQSKALKRIEKKKDEMNDILITNGKESIEDHDNVNDDLETMYNKLGGFDHYIMSSEKKKKKKETRWQKLKRKINNYRAKKLIGKKIHVVSMGYIPKDVKNEPSEFISELKKVLHEHILIDEHDNYMDTNTVFVMIKSDGQVWLSKEGSDLDRYTKIGVIPTSKGVSEEFKTVIEITR